MRRMNGVCRTVPTGDPKGTPNHKDGGNSKRSAVLSDAFSQVKALGESKKVSICFTRLSAGVDNLFDVNDHPLFIATDTVPSLGDPVSSNGGGTGNSQAGRAAYVGLTYRF